MTYTANVAECAHMDQMSLRHTTELRFVFGLATDTIVAALVGRLVCQQMSINKRLSISTVKTRQTGRRSRWDIDNGWFLVVVRTKQILAVSNINEGEGGTVASGVASNTGKLLASSTPTQGTAIETEKSPFPASTSPLALMPQRAKIARGLRDKNWNRPTNMDSHRRLKKAKSFWLV